MKKRIREIAKRIRSMFEAVDIWEIISDYHTHFKQSLRFVPRLLTLVILPLVLSGVMYNFVQYGDQFKNFSDKLVTINSIFIPLLINVLMIIQYSAEREKEKTVNLKNLKNIEEELIQNELNIRRHKILAFLRRISSATSMSIILGLVLLIFGVIFSINDLTRGYINIVRIQINVIIFSIIFVFSFWIINIIIILVRVYRLIRYETKENNY